MSKESPGTAEDLSGREEHMQKPHVWQSSVNSDDVVNLAGEEHFWWQSQPEEQLLELRSMERWAREGGLCPDTIGSQLI